MRVHEGRGRRRHAVERGERRERERAPGEGELAVVAVPDSREQQRPGRDGQQDADERQRPRPAQRRAVERCGVSGACDGDRRNGAQDGLIAGHSRRAARDQAGRRHLMRGLHRLRDGPTQLDRRAMPAGQCASSQLSAARASTCERHRQRDRRHRRVLHHLLPPPATSSRPPRPAPRRPARRAPAAASARRASPSPAPAPCAPWRGG